MGFLRWVSTRHRRVIKQGVDLRVPEPRRILDNGSSEWVLPNNADGKSANHATDK